MSWVVGVRALRFAAMASGWAQSSTDAPPPRPRVASGRRSARLSAAILISPKGAARTTSADRKRKMLG